MKIDTFDHAFLEHDGKPEDTLHEILDWSLAPTNAKKARSYIRRYIQHKVKIEMESMGDYGDMAELEIKPDGSQVSKRMLLLSEEDSKDPVRVMELMGYDPLQWKLESCKTRRNFWDVTIKNRSWEGQKFTNNAYMCEVKVRPIQGIISTDFVRRVFEEIGSPSLHVYRSAKGADKLLEIPIMDLHLGKQGWDLETAEKVYRGVIEQIINRVNQYNVKIERIIFPIGQDFFHIDTPKATTTRGTPVEIEGDWHAIFETGVRLLIWTLENLRAIAPVDCMYVASNHDEMLSYCATTAMHYYFKSDDRVTVDLAASPRKYYRYGVNLIGFAHWDEEGKRLEKLMQVEAKGDWGETLFHEWHTGHLHSESALEDGGVIIRRMSSVTPLDEWHIRKGYMGAIRKAQALIWDKETGKELTIDVNILR